MILLTDKEITRIVERATPPRGSYRQDIAKAQLKKVVEWGDELCDIHGKPMFRRQCGYCWQALLGETK